ncbi:hypothetical protein DCE79_02605 [Lysinibacillus sp. 2017]|uniref:hypothetical protein n=1 Tax=unclassified Lysinibacillus TaxID=2636778 RepID=UPI000D52A5E6|nr:MULTISPECIES: hypothetical protein [unclassified Lysinibacillus]AWE06342.1 hypothetical protein DCE79_02605 [Lysinibacillus sp. 2017]TGN35038.1 hypothetical protein E4L99_11795 [Lysinibacillus sp. S2017]
MKTIIRISDVLFKKYGYYVPISEIGYESHEFYAEEIDEALVPKYVIEHLAEPITTESASYTDANGDYYLVMHIETGEVEPYEVWMINDEIIPNFTEMGE